MSTHQSPARAAPSVTTSVVKSHVRVRYRIRLREWWRRRLLSPEARALEDEFARIVDEIILYGLYGDRRCPRCGGELHEIQSWTHWTGMASDPEHDECWNWDCRWRSDTDG